ncbi:MAG: hypothetical protein Q9170_002288 [Blastenia crenularia]
MTFLRSQRRSITPPKRLEDSTVETFQRLASGPSLPAKLPTRAFEALPASAKWFKEPWPTFNSSYLGQFGDEMIQLELTSLHSVGPMFQRAEAPFNIFLQWAEKADTNSLHRLYVAQASLDRLPKPLQDDLPIPELVVNAGRGDIYGASIWLGIAPTYTPLHHDPNHNLYLQLAGHKVVRLLEPDAGQSVFAAVQGELGKNNPSSFRGEEMMMGREKDLLDTKIWSQGHEEVTMHGVEFAGFEASLEAGESMFIPRAMSARDVRFGAMAKYHVSVAETLLCNAYMLQTAAAPGSKTPSTFDGMLDIRVN